MTTQVNQEILVPPHDAIRLLWKALEVGDLVLMQSAIGATTPSVTFNVCTDGSETAHTVTLYSTGQFNMRTVIVLGEKE